MTVGQSQIQWHLNIRHTIITSKTMEQPVLKMDLDKLRLYGVPEVLKDPLSSIMISVKIFIQNDFIQIPQMTINRCSWQKAGIISAWNCNLIPKSMQSTLIHTSMLQLSLSQISKILRSIIYLHVNIHYLCPTAKIAGLITKPW